MKTTEIAELMEKLGRKGFDDKALVVKNLLKCDRDFIDKLNKLF